jgi:glycosyltransferase involved in cell wall biosynthesis
MQPPGGGSAVGAWSVEALRRLYDITVLTWTPVDCASINRAFGTSLDPADCRWINVSVASRRLLEFVPLPLALLSMHVLFRKARRLQRERPFDIVIGTMNEIEIGIRAIQYIHYPWAMFPRPDADYRWYHFSLPLRFYRWLCATISGYRKELVFRNVTLANSDWTGAAFARYYGGRSRTLYPPVPGGFPDIPFAARESGFVCVGRISGEKEIEKLIEILAGVRARGHDIRFHIVGHVDDSAYARRLYRVARPDADWISFHHDLPRDALVALIARNRYGIHGMVGEHFGIAPAELQRGGCITFVPDDGGVGEIGGADPRVVYHSVADAIEKIDRILADDALRDELARDVRERKDRFSEERFMAELVEVVEAFSR